LLQGNADGKFLSTEVAGCFVSAVFDLYTTSSGWSPTNKASLKYPDYSGNDVMYKIKSNTKINLKCY